TYSARDPDSGATVLLHVLPLGCENDPKKKFLEFAPGCPGKILDSGLDTDSQRSFVVTEYPKDRKALLLWIKSLSAIAAKPAPPKSAAPAPVPAPAPASDGATRMFDPSAIFGAPPSAEPLPQAATPASDGATRMFDPSAIFGAPPADAPAQAAAAAADGATRMFDPSAVFGGASAPSDTAPAARPSPPPTPHPSASHDSRPKTDPFADLKAALSRSAGSQPVTPPATETPKKEAGEFTRRFELPKEFRGAPLRVDRTSQSQPGSKPGAIAHDASDHKGVFTLMMEAYANRAEEPSPAPAAKPAENKTPPSPNSDGATRMFDPSAIFGGGTAETQETPASSSKENPADYPATVRMPALGSEEEKQK
ncbi:MAG: hypothetical protein ACRD3E_00500, partial [Terriglobales bacterium]